LLLLPEVFSQLDLAKVKRDFALESDDKDEAELRDSRWWGRLYVDGWPQTIQYLRAHFGEPPPRGRLPVVLADPPDACGALAGGAGRFGGAIVVARRGTCTFSSKARRAAAANVSAIVLVNNAEGNEHLAGPDAHGVKTSVSMVAQADGGLLMRHLERDPPAQALFATMAPMHCAERSSVMGKSLGSDLCAPATAADRRMAADPMEGGWLTLPSGPGLSPRKHEFMIGTFGIAVDTSRPFALAAPGGWEPVPGSSDDTGCSALAGGGGLTFEEFNELAELKANATRDGDAAGEAEVARREAALASSPFRGKAVVVPRGGCAFVNKAKNAQASGAAMVLIANTHTGLSRFGVEPRWKGLGITIPVVLVTDLAGVELAAAASAGEAARFTLSKLVSTKAWDEVEHYRSGPGFSGLTPDAKPWRVLANVTAAHAKWHERLAAIEAGYAALPRERRASQQHSEGAAAVAEHVATVGAEEAAGKGEL